MQRYLYNKKTVNLDTHENDLHYGEIGLTTNLLPHRFFNDRTLWWVIALANKLPGDSLFIEPGLQLFIPGDINKIIKDLQIKNSIGK